jgi:sugar/nucleoside kinase (ribokinase family)
MSIDIVTVGCVCADVMVRPVEQIPERGKLALVPNLEIHLGGLAGVTASVFSQLGGNAAFIGKLGADGFGDYVVAQLNAAGVLTGHVTRSDDANTSATVVLISEDGERTFLHHLGTNAVTTEHDIEPDFVKQAKLLHWGGPAVTPMLDGAPMGRVFKQARESGVKTSMDTCFDGNGTWFPLIEHALPHLDIVMSSLEEAQHYTGKEAPEDIADFYRSFGVETVMIKLGPDGMFLKDSGASHLLPGHKVDVVDTTGAGDASCGGFLYGYVNGWDLLRCGTLANAVGALTVQHMGGAEAIRSLEETLAFGESA